MRQTVVLELVDPLEVVLAPSVATLMASSTSPIAFTVNVTTMARSLVPWAVPYEVRGVVDALTGRDDQVLEILKPVFWPIQWEEDVTVKLKRELVHG